MRRIALITATIMGGAVLSVSPLSLDYSATHKSIAVLDGKTNAAVGKPLSAGVRLQMVWDNLSCLGTEALARLG